MHIVNLKEQKTYMWDSKPYSLGLVPFQHLRNMMSKENSPKSSLSPYSEYFFNANTYLLVP